MIQTTSTTQPYPVCVTRPDKAVPPLPAFPLPVELPDDWGRGASTIPLSQIAAIAGCTEVPPQLGLLGWTARGKWPLGLDLNSCLALGFFGDNGSGKSYGMSVCLEMMISFFGSICMLPKPWAGLYLHYHESSSYPPEIYASVRPNQDLREVGKLVHGVRALPAGLTEIVSLTLKEQVAAVQGENPHVPVYALRFALRELGLDWLRVLLGLSEGASPLYVRQVERLLRELLRSGKTLTWRRLLRAIARERFAPLVRQRLLERLALVQPWIDDRGCLRDYIKPGRLLVIDLRDEWLSKELALNLFGMAVAVLALHPAQRGEDACPLVVAYDELHKFMGSKALRRQLVAMVRERRHLKLALLLACQDPICVPGEVLALLDGAGVFRHGAEKWNKHLSQYIAGLRGLTAQQTAELPSGVMWFWAKHWLLLEERLEIGGPLLVEVRPRVSHHGGKTRTAVERT